MKRKSPDKVEWRSVHEWVGWLVFPESNCQLFVRQDGREFYWWSNAHVDCDAVQGISCTLVAAKLACEEAVRRREAVRIARENERAHWRRT
jgi:hypothetical protein